MDNGPNTPGELVPGCTLGENCVAVTARVWYRDEGDVRAVFVEQTPFLTYNRHDPVQQRFCAAQLVETGLVKPGQAAAAFEVHPKTLERARRQLRTGGVPALVPHKRGPKGRSKADGAVQRRIRELFEAGHSKRGIADRLGLCDGTVRSVLKEHGITPRGLGAEPMELSLTPAAPEATAMAELDLPGAATALGADSAAADEVIREIAVPAGVSPAWASTQADRDADRRESAMVPEIVVPEVAVEATSIPYAAPAEQLAAMVGLIEEAPVEFAPARGVPMAGVLLGLALLGTTGLLQEARVVYGRLQNGWYGLRPMIWTLFAMALLRVRRPEGLKAVDPAALGLVLGLPRAPEVKTVRRKLQEMARRALAAKLHRNLAKRRADQDEENLAYLYVDGHVRAYSGKRRIGKAYVTTRKSVQRAETDYWVNLTDGQPLLVVHAEANEKLTQMMQTILREVRQVIGDRRVMIVFDRGGWSQELFRTILAEGFDLLTYRKAPLSDWPAYRFQTERLRIDGHEVEYALADGDFIEKGWPRLRCLAVKRADGQQTQILCNRYDLDPALLAYRMFGRWQQENWFKYMGENFALDVLVSYAVVPDDPERLVANPQWRKLDRQVRAAHQMLQEAEAAYGRSRLSKTAAKERDRRAAAVSEARAAYEQLRQQRRAQPRQVPLKEVPNRDPVRLEYERKLLTDTIKMCAYHAETQLFAMLRGSFARNEEEGRAVVREMFQAGGDLLPRDGELHVCLEQLSAPRYTEALMSLCEQLNERDLRLPETDFRLRFHVKPRPETRQK